MKARFVFACAAAGIAMTAFGTTTASADESFTGTLEFSSDVARPGDSVDIFGTCDDPAFTSAPVLSDILDASDLTRTGDGNGGFLLWSVGTVKAAATPEWWPVSFMCGDTLVQGHLRVEIEGHAAIGIQDEVIRPGQEVLVVASCASRDFVNGKVDSPVLVSEDLVREDGGPDGRPLFAKAKVNNDARPGTYPISFTCAEKKVGGEFTVTADSTPAPVKKKAQVPVKPKGAADTGALEQRAAAPASNNDDSSALVIGAGAAALLAAGGVGAWAYRRRQRV